MRAAQAHSYMPLTHFALCACVYLRVPLCVQNPPNLPHTPIGYLSRHLGCIVHEKLHFVIITQSFHKNFHIAAEVVVL